MKIFNTMTKKKEEFIPLEEGKVKMYVCGPTVYNFIHIGNARPMIVFDTVRRYFEYKGYDVNYVSNFTDVDDKIIKKAIEEGVTADEISKRYIAECKKDMDGMNIKPATKNPLATEEICGMVDMIQTLIDKGFAYEKNGTVYYSTRKFKDYGKLSHKNLDDLRSGERSLLVSGEDEKEDPLDFVLWKPKNGISLLRTLFEQVKRDIIPCLESNLHLDFTGKIFNSLNDWVSIENDKKNDVVLTPRYVTTLMAKMARTDKDSFVWDATMGSGGFLVSAMDLMVKDAKSKISDEKELEKKIQHIKENQILGVEILGNVYVLAVLNMVLMDGVGAKMINGDSHTFNLPDDFPANVFLLNPPYSADGKGFVFVYEATRKMAKGYAAVIIQDSAGNGQGLPYTKKILEHCTLEAAVKMPNVFNGKASVGTYIFLFKVNRPHEEDDVVTFIDFTEDGYTRQNRKKSTQEVNLKNTDHAEERYAEVLALTTGKMPKTHYYTEENGKVIKDTITLNGDDWTFEQHQQAKLLPSDESLKTTIANYMSWKIAEIMEKRG